MIEGQSCAVVCTSTASLEVFSNKPSIIYTLPLNIHTAQGDYRDGIDISSQQFYQYLQKHPSELPYTSPPDFDKAVALLLKLKQENYTDVIVPTLSVSLSQTYKVI
ncbi:DegV family protein [Suttonella ornithocola]|uniref:EDD domain protein, DegV family n=1 Tax=Suttonella ornithocola TaxID=279832 RepID=A0A380MLR3_9GAMM|nr:DegV family protein [Suttonella ornithocola]SUO93114.1 EDD domain protein, DegV family [Suttonella ornithocola]